MMPHLHEKESKRYLERLTREEGPFQVHDYAVSVGGSCADKRDLPEEIEKGRPSG